MKGCTPRYNLQGHWIKEESFEEGTLENWVKGALLFDGKSQYCKVDAEKSGGLDMESNNFLIEVVLCIENGKSQGGIVNKANSDRGYNMILDEGKIKIGLKFDTSNCHRVSEN